jgi:protein-L-isoaspartate(D-aspartate) O-methyltransferase
VTESTGGAILTHVRRDLENSAKRWGRALVSSAVLTMLLGFMGTAMGNGGHGQGDDTQPDWAAQRRQMVEDQIQARGITDPATLRAMGSVPRHEFVPADSRDLSYRDYPLPIGYNQTISQPYIVAYMTQALRAKPKSKVLEIGTGSGYQAAVLAAMDVEVYSIEIVEPLGRQAQALFARLGYRVRVRIGDGYKGWPEAAPFDGIIVTAAPPTIPSPLVEQLKEGGRMVVPVGRANQTLQVLIKRKGQLVPQQTLPVRFVPMVGQAGG